MATTGADGNNGPTMCEYCDFPTLAAVECCDTESLCLLHFALNGHTAHESFKVISKAAYNDQFSDFSKRIIDTRRKVCAKVAALPPEQKSTTQSILFTAKRKAVPVAPTQTSPRSHNKTANSTSGADADARQKKVVVRTVAKTVSPFLTTRVDNKARTACFLSVEKALAKKADDSYSADYIRDLASEIELQLFLRHRRGNVPTSTYSSQAHEILFCIKDPANRTFATRILNQAVELGALATLSSTEMASPAQRKVRTEQYVAQTPVAPSAQGTLTKDEYNCDECKSTQVYKLETDNPADCRKQEIWGSASAPTWTYALTCAKCSHQWTL